MDIYNDLQKYGWLGITIYFLVKEIAPFVMNKVFPERAKEAQAKRAAEALLLKSQIDRETREEEHRRSFEDRIASALEQMSLAITITNERLTQLTNVTSGLSQFTQDAVGDMRETVAKMNKRESQPKMKPTRQPKK